MQLDNLGIDYIERRTGLIDAVTLADAKRVAKRLLDGGLLVTVVGPAAARLPPSRAIRAEAERSRAMRPYADLDAERHR